MKNALFALGLMCLLSSAAMAETTITSGSTVNPNDIDGYDATEAIENGYGLTPEDFGLPNQTMGPDGQPLTEEELEALKNLRDGENEAGSNKQENRPSQQFYRGAVDVTKQKYEPPRTHRMYEDTRY